MPRSSIVVGTDLSITSRPALQRAEQLARALGDDLVVVHVVQEFQAIAVTTPVPGAWGTDLGGWNGVTGRRALRAAARVAESRVGAWLRRIGIEPDRTFTLSGVPHRVLLRVARSHAARLIVTGAHRRAGRVGAFFLGSTAERLLHAGDFPVLLVRHAGTRPYRDVLVPLDAGAEGDHALDLAARVAPGASFRIVHFKGAGSRRRVDSPGESLRRDLEARVGRAALTRSRVDVEVLPGEPRDGILREARRTKPDLVALATRSRRGLGRLRIGSVADHTLRTVPADVLALPPGVRRAQRGRRERTARASGRRAPVRTARRA